MHVTASSHSAVSQTGPQGTGTAATSAPSSTPLDTAVRNGSGPLSGRQIAVGDGLATQRLRSAKATPPPHAFPDIKADASPADNGIARLKERQLGHGDGQVSDRSRSASTG